jgi:hypothetical protein
MMGSILIHGLFLFLLFVLIFWTLESLSRLHQKVDEIPGSGAGVTTILLQLRLNRQAFYDDIEGLRFQLDPLHQSLDGQRREQLALDQRLSQLTAKYDELLSIVEKNAVSPVDSRHGADD